MSLDRGLLEWNRSQGGSRFWTWARLRLPRDGRVPTRDLENNAGSLGLFSFVVNIIRMTTVISFRLRRVDEATGSVCPDGRIRPGIGILSSLCG